VFIDPGFPRDDSGFAAPGEPLESDSS
jgi:hypothetical protein